MFPLRLTGLSDVDRRVEGPHGREATAASHQGLVVSGSTEGRFKPNKTHSSVLHQDESPEPKLAIQLFIEALLRIRHCVTTGGSVVTKQASPIPQAI